jgi:hypothetical protein
LAGWTAASTAQSTAELEGTVAAKTEAAKQLPDTVGRRPLRKMRHEMVRTMSEAFRSIGSNSAQGVVDGYAFLLRRILHGDAAALDALGSMLTYGVGVEKNPRLAAACYAVASRASHAGATYNLAGALIEGAGIPKDVQKGLRLLRSARRAGEAAATNYLGFCYRTGEGVKKDARHGFALSFEAARAGVAAAQYDVGMCLLNGTGVKKDPAEAEHWIARAAKGGDRHAQEYLGRQTRRRRARQPSARRRPAR